MSYALDKAMIEALEAVVGIDHTETGVMTTDNFIQRLDAVRDRARELWKEEHDGTG